MLSPVKQIWVLYYRKIMSIAHSTEQLDERRRIMKTRFQKTKRKTTGLPWRCPDHPDAQILHSWDNNYTVWGDGYPRGGHTSNHKYECNECHIELAAPKQEEIE